MHLTTNSKHVNKKVPAVYDTASVHKLAKAASTSKTSKPLVCGIVNTSCKATDGYVVGTPTLYAANVTGVIVRQLRQALNIKGYKARQVDGIYGARTANAGRNIQQDGQIPDDGKLTIELIEALKIKYQADSAAQSFWLWLIDLLHDGHNQQL